MICLRAVVSRLLHNTPQILVLVSHSTSGLWPNRPARLLQATATTLPKRFTTPDEEEKLVQKPVSALIFLAAFKLTISAPTIPIKHVAVWGAANCYVMFPGEWRFVDRKKETIMTKVRFGAMKKMNVICTNAIIAREKVLFSRT